MRRRGNLILVAEDNDINQNVILYQLALLGYVAELTANGREALDRWRKAKYALLLTDLNMPEMDGYELTAAIRRAEGEGQRLPIIALTANVLKREESRCKEAGMDDYLSKPVLLERLQVMLEKWLPAPALPSGGRLAVLDMAVLPTLVGNDPTLIARLLRDYRRSAKKAESELRAALTLGNWKALANGAHKLKSSSRAVGALDLGDVCARLELAGNAGDTDAIQTIALKLENALKAVLAALDLKVK